MNNYVAGVKEYENAQEDVKNKAAVIFMTNWMKRKGVDKEKLLDLLDWSDEERQNIIRIYKYSY